MAHNCIIGDDVKLANGVLLSGHVEVGEKAFLSGNAIVQQFSRVGELAILGGGSRVTSDVVPYLMVAPDGVVGPNVVGLRRAGFDSEQRKEIRAVYKLLFRTDVLFSEAVEQAAAFGQDRTGTADDRVFTCSEQARFHAIQAQRAWRKRSGRVKHVRIIIAPDKFKDALDADGIAEALATGLRAARPDVGIVCCPARRWWGGNRAGCWPGRWERTELVAEVLDPLGGPRTARWWAGSCRA